MVPAMASIEGRDPKLRVVWRLGGRDSRKQYVTTHSEKRAVAIKAFVESRNHRITDDEVYRIMFPSGERDTGIPTLRDWIATWLSTKKDVLPGTLNDYRQLLRTWVVPRIGDYSLDALTEEVLKDWVEWIQKQESARGRKLGADSIRKAHAVLHQVLGAAVPQLIPANPAAKPVGSRKSKTGLPPHVRYHAVFLTPAESELVLAACPVAIRDLVEVALYTGLRLGELLVLRAQDVELDGDEPVLYVTRALKKDGTIGGPKSEMSRRAVTLSNRALGVLRRCAQGKAQPAFLFTPPRGLRWDKDAVRRYWGRAVATARRCPDHMPPTTPRGSGGRLRVYRNDEVSTCDCPTRLTKTPRFHDLRHTHASWLIAAKWNVYVISRRMGHESIKTTMDIYGHLLRQGGAEGLEALDRLAA